jgi:DNA polymerase III delta prime subunit
MDDLKYYIPWFEKYIPTTFSECDHSQNITLKLKKIAENCSLSAGLPNCILYGPVSSGKYSRICSMLSCFFKETKENVFQQKFQRINVENGDFSVEKSTKEKGVFAFMSSVHCELDLNQPNIEKCLMDFLDYFSRTKNVALDCHKYIILRHMDSLKRQTQNRLRRFIENKNRTLRILATSSGFSKIIEPLRSRFLCLPVPLPTEEETILMMKKIAQKENWKITKKKIEKMIETCKTGNMIHLKQLFLIMEGSHLIEKKELKLKKIYIPEKKKIIINLVKKMKQGDRILLREYLEKMYICDQDNFAELLTKDLFWELLKEIEEKTKTKLTHVVSEWSNRLIEDNLFYPLLQAEGYLFEVCCLLNW